MWSTHTAPTIRIYIWSLCVHFIAISLILWFCFNTLLDTEVHSSVLRMHTSKWPTAVRIWSAGLERPLTSGELGQYFTLHYIQLIFDSVNSDTFIQSANQSQILTQLHRDRREWGTFEETARDMRWKLLSIGHKKNVFFFPNQCHHQMTHQRSEEEWERLLQPLWKLVRKNLSFQARIHRASLP